MAYRMSVALAAALLAGVPAGSALAQATPDPATAPAATPAPTSATPDAAPAATTPAEPAAPATPAPATDAPATDAPATDAPATDATAAPAATDPAAPAPAGIPDTAATTTAPPGEPPAGTFYTKSTHTDWTLRCMKTQDGNDPCELYQLMKDAQGSAVAEISVIPYKGEAAAILNFVAPLETDLGAGLGLQVDSAKAAKYPFMVCAPIGCISRIGISQAELDGLKRGSQATVNLVPFGSEAEKDAVRVNMSLKGFTAGFDAVTAAQAAAPAATPGAAAAPAPAEGAAAPAAPAAPTN